MSLRLHPDLGLGKLEKWGRDTRAVVHGPDVRELDVPQLGKG